MKGTIDMADDPLIHPYTTLTTPAGEAANIDREMVPVIEALWSWGLRTTACCQNVGEATRAVRDAKGIVTGYRGEDFIGYFQDWALLKMPVIDALRLIGMLMHVPAFAERITGRWEEQSWRMNIPLVVEDRTPEAAADALLHFPSAQIPELTLALATIEADAIR